MIRLVVPDVEVKERSHFWDDKQDMLKPYAQCAVCSVCSKCEFTIRDDAKFYVDRFIAKDKPQLKEKKNLFAVLVSMDSRLRPITGEYDNDMYRCLLYCVCVRYIRKAALETPVLLSDTETRRVLERIMGSI